MDVTLQVPALPEAGATVLGGDAVFRPGGKGANQAVAAARAGAAVSFVGCVGPDANGRLVLEALQRASVDTTRVVTAEARSTGFAVVLVADGGENAIAVSPGANHALTPGHVDDVRADIASAEVLLLQLELPLGVVAHAVDVAHDVGTPAVLNLAPAAVVPPETLARLGVLVVNHGEAEQLLGYELPGLDEVLAAADALLGIGPEAVVVTAGADGAAVADRSGVTHVAAEPARVVDTSGAGDAFTGTLAAALSAGASIRDAASAATRAAALALETPGAQLNGSRWAAGAATVDRV
jgi:ribokinase